MAALELSIVLLAFAVLWPTTASLIRDWLDTDQMTYTHGFLVLAISLWLLLRDRDALLDSDRGSRLALVALGLLGVLWLVAVRAAVQTVHQLVFLAIVMCAITAVFGARAARRHAFAIAYLLFAMPIWGSINGILQAMTVAVSDVLLRVTGIPAYVEGNLVHLAAGVFEVEGGCSGLHFLIVGLALGALYGEVHRDSLHTRIKLLALALGFSLLANYVRVYGVILTGYLTDMQHYLVRVSHNEFGWGVFAVVMTGFFWFARRMPARVMAVSAPAVASEPTTLLAGNVLLTLAVLAIAPVWNVLAPPEAAEVEERPLSNVESWSGPRSPSRTHWQPAYASADRQQLAEYVGGSGIVTVFVAEYWLQHQGHELVAWNNSLVGEDAHDLVAAREIASPLRAVEWEMLADDSSYLLWYFYEIGSRHVTSELAAQVWYGIDSLFTNPASKIVALRAECTPDCRAARTVLTSFVDAAKSNLSSPLSP